MKESVTSNILVLEQKVNGIKEKLDEVNQKQDQLLIKIESQYITRNEFLALQEKVNGHSGIIAKIAWIVVSAILLAVIGLVLKTGGTI